MAVPTRTLRVPPDPGGPNLVELRSVVVAIVVTAILTMIAAVAFSIVLIGQPENGEQGPPGPPGQRGPTGPAGVAPKVDKSTVWKALAADPERLAKLVQKNLTVAPPTDQSELLQVQDDVATLASDLRALCSQLQGSSALANASLTCP